MFVTSEAELGLNFLKTLPAAHNDSLVFSPISIALVLSIVHAGAKGNSKKQIEDTLLNKATCNNCEFISHFSSIQKKLRKRLNNGVAVNMANKLYLKNGSTAQRQFLTAVGQNYGAEVRSVDFRKPDSIDKINGFVKTKTKGIVEKIITTRDSVENANGLLINAMAFSGAWEDGFDESPALMSFNRNEKPGMSFLNTKQRGWNVRDYASDDLFRVLTLKYADPRFEYTVFLPKKQFGLNEALKKLDSRRYDSLMNKRKPTYVYSEMPVFKIETRLSLKQTLKAIGITEMFSDFADLSGIADNAKISEGIHKSVIEIDEYGSFANPNFESYRNADVNNSRPLEFIADHPFLFATTFLNHTINLGIYRGIDWTRYGK